MARQPRYPNFPELPHVYLLLIKYLLHGKIKLQ